MPRLSRHILASQDALVARLVSAGATRTEIARTAGVDASLVSKWTSEGEDGREVQLSCLTRLADCYGWDLVVGPMASPAGFEVSRRTAAPVPVVLGSVRLVEVAAALVGEAHRAHADGKLTGAEKEALRGHVGTARKAVDELAAAVA